MIPATNTKRNTPTPSAPKFDPVPQSYELLPKQTRMAKWLPLIQGFCNFSAFVLNRKKLSPRENTRRCYEQFFDPLCSDTGVWPDYTEGYYPTGTESYGAAKLKQFDFILDQTNAGPDTRLMDLGCGNGGLMLRAKERGCGVHGVTVSRKQAQTCEDMGLEVTVTSFLNIQNSFPAGGFDIVVMNGPTEHFVTEQDVLEDRKEAVQNDIFEVASYLLKPGGRLFITCIHVKEPSDVREIVKPAIKHPVGSYKFFGSILVALYSGWYPEIGDYEKAAGNNGMQKTFERDATHDYYLTSRLWGRKLRTYLSENKRFRNRFLRKLFWNDPRYFFTAFLYWYYDAWTWQFRPAPQSPMYHRWLMFEKD